MSMLKIIQTCTQILGGSHIKNILYWRVRKDTWGIGYLKDGKRMRRAEKGQKKDDLRGTGRTKGMNYLEAVED